MDPQNTKLFIAASVVRILFVEQCRLKIINMKTYGRVEEPVEVGWWLCADVTGEFETVPDSLLQLDYTRRGRRYVCNQPPTL